MTLNTNMEFPGPAELISIIRMQVEDLYGVVYKLARQWSVGFVVQK